MTNTTDHATLTRITDGGRIVIPAHMRHELGIQVGQQLELIRHNDTLVLRRYQPLARAQELAAKHMGKAYGNTSVTDEFLEERRQEALREAQDE